MLEAFSSYVHDTGEPSAAVAESTLSTVRPRQPRPGTRRKAHSHSFTKDIPHSNAGTTMSSSALSRPTSADSVRATRSNGQAARARHRVRSGVQKPRGRWVDKCGTGRGHQEVVYFASKNDPRRTWKSYRGECGGFACVDTLQTDRITDHLLLARRNPCLGLQTPSAATSRTVRTPFASSPGCLPSANGLWISST